MKAFLKKGVRRCAVLCIAVFLSGCGLDSYGLNEFFTREHDVRSRTETLEKLEDGSLPTPLPTGKYSVLVLTDVHFGAEKLPGNGPRFDEAFFAWLDAYEPKPAFCVGLGDMAEHGWEDEYRRYQEFTGKLLERKIQTYNAVGNHDLYNSGWKHYQNYLFPYKSFYYFETPRFSWYFIDTASGALGATQMRQLKKTMETDPKYKMVMTHFPLWANGHFYFSLQDSMERNRLIHLFARNNVKAVLTGHTHKETVSDFGKFMEYNHPGYFARGGWGIISIDEDAGSVESKIWYLDASRALCVRFPRRDLCSADGRD